jgi:hypothetical protein
MIAFMESLYFARHGRRSPIRANHSSSVSTLTPAARALSSLLPAPGPATTKSGLAVFLYWLTVHFGQLFSTSSVYNIAKPNEFLMKRISSMPLI